MDEGDRVNGHRVSGLLPMLFAAMVTAGPLEAQEPPFDVDGTLAAVVRLRAEVPGDAYTAQYLGTEREGNGVLIGGDGLILTIGYLILEAMAVTVADSEGRMIPAEIVAYDYESGFGLVRAMAPLGAPPLSFGNSDGLRERDPVLVAGAGGRNQAIGAVVVSRRTFAGYWEYLLEDAIFTAPPHPEFGGAALIGMDGKLLGIGSLYVEDAAEEERTSPGNMFVPIDALKPILGALLEQDESRREARPWLGMFTAEHLGRLVVLQLAADGPAARAGLQPGDTIVKVGDRTISELATFYRHVWSLGPSGTAVPLTVLRGRHAFEVTVQSGNRYDFLKLDRSY